MKGKYQHLFFDLDHTLWDFQTNSSETLLELYEDYQLQNMTGVEGKEFLRTYYKINDIKWDLYRQGKITKERLRKERFYEAFANFGVEDEGLSWKIERQYIDLAPHRTALMPGALELLDYLNHKYHLHIITNGFSEIQDIKLSKSGLKPYFKIIMTSEQVGVTKPHPKIFKESLQQAGSELDHSIMIGDNLEADVLGAKNFGMDQVFFNPDRKQHDEKVTLEVAELLELREWL